MKEHDYSDKSTSDWIWLRLRSDRALLLSKIRACVEKGLHFLWCSSDVDVTSHWIKAKSQNLNLRVIINFKFYMLKSRGNTTKLVLEMMKCFPKCSLLSGCFFAPFKFVQRNLLQSKPAVVETFSVRENSLNWGILMNRASQQGCYKN